MDADEESVGEMKNEKKLMPMPQKELMQLVKACSHVPTQKFGPKFGITLC